MKTLVAFVFVTYLCKSFYSVREVNTLINASQSKLKLVPQLKPRRQNFPRLLNPMLFAAGTLCKCFNLYNNTKWCWIYSSAPVGVQTISKSLSTPAGITTLILNVYWTPIGVIGGGTVGEDTSRLIPVKCCSLVGPTLLQLDINALLIYLIAFSQYSEELLA